MHYYQHHIGDFIRDTSRLSDEQCMAYMRLIWLYYESEQPLPNSPRSLAFRIGSSEEVVSLILEAFFKLDGDTWMHTRCDAEIAEYEAICNRNRTNGKAGGRPKKTQPVSNGLPEETQPEPHRNPNQYPVTNNQESKALATDESDCAGQPEIAKAKADPIPYEQIFDAYSQTLPELPQVRIRDEARRKAIRSLWRSDSRFQSVDFWGRYYGSVRTSKFLMGMNAIGFDWLMKPANFKKVVEGNYQ